MTEPARPGTSSLVNTSWFSDPANPSKILRRFANSPGDEFTCEHLSLSRDKLSSEHLNSLRDELGNEHSCSSPGDTAT